MKSTTAQTTLAEGQDEVVEKIIQAVWLCVDYDEDDAAWLDRLNARKLVKKILDTATPTLPTDIEAVLKEIRERRAKVIGTPWWANIHAQVFTGDNHSGAGSAVAECLGDDVAEFIAHAPTDIDRLLSIIDSLTKQEVE